MMLTFRARKVAVLAVFLSLTAACSREQQDWRSAEASDTVESYSRFLNRHPESELATQARTRVTQLTEEREWQQASSADTADAYRQFLAQHPNGKWAQEARIRIQNFALNGLPPAGPPMVTAPDPGPVTSTLAAAPPQNGAVAMAAPGELAHAAGTAEMSANSAAHSQLSTQASPGDLAQPSGVARGGGTSQATGSALGGNTAQAAAAALGAGAAATQGLAAQPANPTRAPAPVSPTPPKYSTPYVSTPGGAVTNVSSTNSSSTNAPTGYGVQLGAFGSESAANNEWQQLTARFGSQLHGLTPHVVAANTATGALFRLQAQVPDEAYARSLCDMLRKQSQPCVPVLPH